MLATMKVGGATIESSSVSRGGTIRVRAFGVACVDAFYRRNLRHHVATATTVDRLCDLDHVPDMFYQPTRP
jgi:hypothetical protein